MPMNILHIADTHLGYSAYRKITEDGINQREQDIYQAFQQIIDYAIEHKPDIILHAGDLFTSVRPTNRAITFTLQQLLRISSENIPFVIIAGNHEQPKLRETGHIFSVFHHLPNIYPVYHEAYEPLELKIDNETLCVHAVPHINNPEEYQEELEQIKINSAADYNLLLTHGSIKGIKELSMHDFNELYIPQHHLSSSFDYVALGHYHKHTRVTEKAYYPGSTEALTFSDANEQKGFLTINLLKNIPSVRFHTLQIRSVIDTPSIDCSGLSYEDITQRILHTIENLPPKDTIFRLNLLHIPLPSYRGLDFDAIRKQSMAALHYEIKASILDKDDSLDETHVKIEGLPKEFVQYMNKQTMQEKEMLLKKGLQYINEIETQVDEL